MDDGTGLARSLGRLGDILLIGLLSSLASLGVVTIAASWGAAVSALTGARDSGVVEAWAAGFRRRIRSTVGLSLVLVTVALVVVADMLFAVFATTGPLRLPVVAAAVILFVVTASLLPHLLVRSGTPELGLRELLRDAVGLAVAAPTITLLSIALGTVLAGVMTLAPFLIPLLFGLGAAASAPLHRGALAALLRRISAVTPANSDLL